MHNVTLVANDRWEHSLGLHSLSLVFWTILPCRTSHELWSFGATAGQHRPSTPSTVSLLCWAPETNKATPEPWKVAYIATLCCPGRMLEVGIARKSGPVSTSMKQGWPNTFTWWKNLTIHGSIDQSSCHLCTKATQSIMFLPSCFTSGIVSLY